MRFLVSHVPGICFPPQTGQVLSIVFISFTNESFLSYVLSLLKLFVVFYPYLAPYLVNYAPMKVPYLVSYKF